MWVKVDDEMPEHAKFRGIRRIYRTGAIGLHTTALCYCNRRLTDGFIPHGFVDDAHQGDTLAKALVGAGVWDPVDDGYVIHDFLDYQPSSADVKAKREELSKVRAAVGRMGAQARWQNGKQDGK